MTPMLDEVWDVLVERAVAQGHGALLFGAGRVLRRAWTASGIEAAVLMACLLYTSPSPRDLSTSRMPSSA